MPLRTLSHRYRVRAFAISGALVPNKEAQSRSRVPTTSHTTSTLIRQGSSRHRYPVKEQPKHSATRRTLFDPRPGLMFQQPQRSQHHTDSSSTNAQPTMPSTRHHHQPTSNASYNTVLQSLVTHLHVFHSPPTSPHPLLIPQTQSSSVPTISSLSLHPTLESTLHLLNADLPSAHFLLRHAQAAPQHEMMYLHGILHRIEGDVDNTRAWYGDVEGSGVFRDVWGSGEDGDEGGGPGGKGWKVFLERVEAWRDRVRSRKGAKAKTGDQGGGGEVMDWTEEEAGLRETSLEEILKVLEYCEKKFGVGMIDDVSKEYTMNGEHGDIASKMIIGGEGWREF